MKYPIYAENARMLAVLARHLLTTGTIRALFLVLLVISFAACKTGPTSKTFTVSVNEGTELVASLSPDGNKIAFILLGQVWVVDRAGGQASAVTDVVSDPREDWAIAWAPDSRQLAINALRGGLRVVDVVSRKVMVVSERDDIMDQVWSLDGKRITVTVLYGDALGFWDFPPVAGGQPIRIAKPSHRPGMPAYSPDGRYLAYSGPISEEWDPTSESDLWEIDLVTGKERRLTEDSVVDSYPAYSPDGQWLAFLSDRSGSRQVWLLPRGGGEARPLTRDAEDVYLGPLTWLPDSRGVMYTRAGKIRVAWQDGAEESTIEFTAELSVTRWQGTRRTEIPRPNERRRARGIFTPALSPDGKRIAFAALGDLWIADVAGGEPARLTQTPADESYPRWLPDGSGLAYLCAPPGADCEVRVLEMEKPGAPRTVLTAPTTEFVWSPDGRRLAYAEADKVGWIDLESASKQEIAKEQSMPRLLGWSAKEDSIYFATSAFGPPPTYRMLNKVWRIGSGGGAPEECKWPQDSSLHAALSSDLTRVAYSVSGVGFHARTADLTAPTRVPDPSPRFYSWSADGRFLLYLSGANVRLLNVERGVPRTLRISPEYRTPPAPQPLLIRNTRIIDGTGAHPSAVSDILVSGGRIRQIAAAGRIASRTGTREIDAAGFYLLPGLFNTHRHQYPFRQFPEALFYNGVLAIRDVGTDAEWMQSQRERVEAGELLAPRMFMTGGLVVEEWGLSSSNQRAVDPHDHQSVRTAVVAMSEVGADWIKPFLRNALLDARVIEAAHAQGLPVTSHFVFLSSLARGLNGKEHADLYYRGYTEIFRQDVLAALRAGDILVTPTLVPWSAMMAGLSPVVPLEDKFLEDPALTVFYPPSLIKQAREDTHQSIPGKRLEMLKKFQSWELESVKRLRDAGIRVATGTDTGSPWDEMGVHLEMELLVKAGLTPLEAIRAATLEGARCLGVERDLGTVERGKLADFILVNGDPSQDIRRTREIELVVLGGEPYTRQEILARVRH